MPTYNFANPADRLAHAIEAPMRYGHAQCIARTYRDYGSEAATQLRDELIAEYTRYLKGVYEFVAKKKPAEHVRRKL